ncbi:MAG: hypothetical protein HY057_02305 [Rhodospirillales bacterium]|nr:hypothetical protein [Rhodospirillales bacterium]
MPLKRILLELARTKEFPEGNRHCGYEFVAPLDAKGHFDPAGWKTARDKCVVRRFWQGEDDEHGNLVHAHNRWVFSYGPGDEDDEPIFKFDRHVFVEGEYVSITEHDGTARPFRIVSVR